MTYSMFLSAAYRRAPYGETELAFGIPTKKKNCWFCIRHEVSHTTFIDKIISFREPSYRLKLTYDKTRQIKIYYSIILPLGMKSSLENRIREA